MSSRRHTLAIIHARFPGREGVIARLYRDDKLFRELCHDYRRCAAALDRWRLLDGGELSAQSREYSELLTELGEEIESWLDAAEHGSLRSSELET